MNKIKHIIVRSVLIVLLVAVGGGNLYAQKSQLSGTVSDAENIPLVGASIIVEGTHVGTTTHAEKGQSDRFRRVGLGRRPRQPSHRILVDRSPRHRPRRDRYHAERSSGRRRRHDPRARYRNLRRFERRAAGAHRRGGGQPRCRRRHADRPDFGVEGRRLVGHLRFACGQRRHPRDDQARQEGADVGHLPRLRRLAVAHRHARNGQRRGVHDPQPRNVVQRRQGVDLYRRLHCPLPREQPYRSRQLSAHRLAGSDSHRIGIHPQPQSLADGQHRTRARHDLVRLPRPEGHHQAHRLPAVQRAQQHEHRLLGQALDALRRFVRQRRPPPHPAAEYAA